MSDMDDDVVTTESLIEAQPTAVRELLRWANRVAGGVGDEADRARLAVDIYYQATAPGLRPMRLIDANRPGIGCRLITPNEEDISHHVESIRIDVDASSATRVIVTMRDVRVELKARLDRDRVPFSEKNNTKGEGGSNP